MPRIRPQFSLATLLLLVTIACIAVALWSTARELRRLRAENQQYRDESGYLTISDTKKLHVIQVPATDGNVWRWRVFVPEGRNFWLHLNAGNVPSFGHATRGSESDTVLPAGEYVVSASIAKDIAGARVLRVDFGNGRGTTTMNYGSDWVDRKTKGWTTSTAGGHHTQSAEPGQPLELIRLRVMEMDKEKQPDGAASKQSVAPGGPTDGFLIWIDELHVGKTMGKSP
jgi:hypothetical protein